MSDPSLEFDDTIGGLEDDITGVPLPEPERMSPSEEHLIRRMRAYQRFMVGKATAQDLTIVTTDLRRFCRADQSTFHPDARIAANLDGRREVWLRIMDFSTLEFGELNAKYNVPKRR